MPSRVLRAAGSAVVAVTLFACGTKSTTKDATISTCNADPGGGRPHAEGQVTNTSSKGSAFVIRLGFYDSSGNRVSEGADTVSGVGPGNNAPWHITGAADAKGPLTCKLLTVRRTVAPGS